MATLNPIIPRKGPVDSAEIKTLVFDFSSELATGETLTGTPTVAIERVYGVADANPTSRLSGAAAVSGATVLQKVATLVPGCTYKLRAEISTSAGNKHVVPMLLDAVRF